MMTSALPCPALKRPESPGSGSGTFGPDSINVSAGPVPSPKLIRDTSPPVETSWIRALSVSSRVYCLQEGRVSLEARTDEISRSEITAAYFGVAA